MITHVIRLRATRIRYQFGYDDYPPIEYIQPPSFEHEEYSNSVSDGAGRKSSRRMSNSGQKERGKIVYLLQLFESGIIYVYIVCGGLVTRVFKYYYYSHYSRIETQHTESCYIFPAYVFSICLSDGPPNLHPSYQICLHLVSLNSIPSRKIWMQSTESGQSSRSITSTSNEYQDMKAVRAMNKQTR